MVAPLAQAHEFRAEYAGPVLTAAAVVEQRTPIVVAVFFIQLMGEFVQRHIAAPLGKTQVLGQISPGQNHRAAVVGLALAGTVGGGFHIVFHAGFPRHIGVWIEQYGIQIRVAGIFPPQ